MVKKGLGLFLVVAVMLFGLAFGAMAEEGVTDTEIHIGQWGPQTGPAAPWGAVARGTGVYFDMINAEGGIHGRKIVYHMFDDGYNPAKTKAGVKQLQEGKGMFGWASGVGTSTGLAVKDYLMERKIPWVGPAAGSMHWITPPQRYLFGVYPLYYIEAKALCRYAIDQMGKKRIAIAYQNDDYGKNGLKGAIDELATRKMKLVAKIPIELKDTDMRPHVMKLRQSKADMVLLWGSPVHAVRIVGTAAAMKFAPQWMSTSTCSDFPLMYKISKGLWKGVITAAFSEMPDSDLPLMKQYKKAYDKFAAKGERWGVFFYAGFVFVEPMVEAIKRSGRDLTRERFVKEMEGLKNFQGTSGKISYKAFDPNDPSCRQGQNQTYLIQCQEGAKAKKLTKWMTIN
ncbi:MAG: ABC transporter substrate-binding protein [Thermodesulfobacteriota bacterium]|nr:ABC transporter substrate-binding protein [Thermodesulfobacteriota bacterium]